MKTKTIVVGYDGSDPAERALARAAELAEALAARLVVVSVSRPARVVVTVPAPELEGVLTPSPLGGPVPVGPTPPVEAERPDEAEEIAERQLAQARMTLAPRGLEADYVTAVGDPAERLLQAAEERDAELVVVGSREHGFLERLLARPVDEEIAKRTDRDVLLVH
jgi:nucleotide-binding universal stress UspA family protein